MLYEGVVKLPARNRANHLANPSLHTGVACSHDEHHHLLEQKHGQPVPPDELHLVLHTKKDGTIVDDKAREVHERFRETLSQRLPSEDSQPTQKNRQEAFLTMPGGVRKDGSVPGLGSYGRRLYADVSRP